LPGNKQWKKSELCVIEKIVIHLSVRPMGMRRTKIKLH